MDPLNAPVVLWLQGGPGSSSLFGQFEINGPYQAIFNWHGKTQAKLNPHAWSKRVNIIYIDNPISVGKFEYNKENLTFKFFQFIGK